jgi:hypothetical protein
MEISEKYAERIMNKEKHEVVSEAKMESRNWPDSMEDPTTYPSSEFGRKLYI